LIENYKNSKHNSLAFSLEESTQRTSGLRLNVLKIILPEFHREQFQAAHFHNFT